MENLKYIIEKTLNSYTNENFSEFIRNLILLKNEAAKFPPENMSLPFVDFLMDENMWQWIVESFEKNPNNFDWSAASYVAIDLTDILNNKLEN